MMLCVGRVVVVVVDAHDDRDVLVGAGAEMMTFFAPPSRCARASAALVKKPVDSMTTSTPRSPQGRLAGSRSAKILIVWSSTSMLVVGDATVAGEPTEDAVVLEQVGQRGRVAQVVDGRRSRCRRRRGGPRGRSCGRCGRSR